MMNEVLRASIAVENLRYVATCHTSNFAYRRTEDYMDSTRTSQANRWLNLLNGDAPRGRGSMTAAGDLDNHLLLLSIPPKLRALVIFYFLSLASYIFTTFVEPREGE